MHIRPVLCWHIKLRRTCHFELVRFSMKTLQPLRAANVAPSPTTMEKTGADSVVWVWSLRNIQRNCAHIFLSLCWLWLHLNDFFWKILSVGMKWASVYLLCLYSTYLCRSAPWKASCCKERRPETSRPSVGCCQDILATHTYTPDLGRYLISNRETNQACYNNVEHH